MVCTVGSHLGAVCKPRHVLGSVGDSQPIRDSDTVEEPPSDEATQTGGGVKRRTALFRKVSLIGFTVIIIISSHNIAAFDSCFSYFWLNVQMGIFDQSSAGSAV